MDDSFGQRPPHLSGPGLLATVWPVSLATDSESQRRKKLAVRAGQLTVVVLVVAAVAGALMAEFSRLAPLRALGLLAASVVYLGWSLYGMREAIALLLWEQGPAPQSLRSRDKRRQAAFYFFVQLALAALIYYLGNKGNATRLMWLVLLPPVAHSAVLLRWPGTALVTVLSMGILVFNVRRWHGWPLVPNAMLEFSFAELFTLVFTLLAVSSEKARGEVQRLAAELTEANRKLREYAVQAEELAATRERNRLAREIHDTLGHYLTVVNVQLGAARAVQDHDPARAQSALEKAQALTQQGLQEIRRSVTALRASPLANKPLPDALRQVIQENIAAGLSAELQILGQARSLSPQAELTLYRAGQEGLTNVRKHARTTSARLALDFRATESVTLSVSDQGAGAANTAHGTGGFGLLGLRERAQLLGGEVRVQTAPGAGFSLEVEVPG